MAVAETEPVPAPAPAEPSTPPEPSPATSAPEPEPEPESPPLDEDPNWDDPTKAALGRDEQGRFVKPRHRAQKQQARAEDVPRIQELTRKLRETERERDSLKAQGTPRTADESRQPESTFQPPLRPQALPDQFPTFDQWLQIQGNGDKGYDDYTDQRADWRWQLNHRASQIVTAQQESARVEGDRIKAYNTQLVDARKKYQDFDTVVTNAITVSPVMRAAILASEKGAEIAYALGKNADQALTLARDSWFHDPASPMVMQRYLESLVAIATPSKPSRAQAAQSTGSAAPVMPSPPKPPNPVRTGPIAAGEDLPDDNSSLEDHDRVWGPAARRRAGRR